MTEVLPTGRRFGGGRIDTAVLRGPLAFAADDPAGPIVVSGLVVPWDTTVELNWFGDTVEFAPGSVVPAGPASRVKFLLEHTRHGMGYGLDFEDTPEGLRGRFAIPRDELDDPDTAAAVRQMRNGIRDALSIGVTLDEYAESEGPTKYTAHLRVTGGHMFETSSVLLPRFDDARVDTVAAHRPTPQPRERITVTATTDPDIPDTDDQADELDDQAAVEASRIAQHLTSTRTGRALRLRAPSRYGSIGDFALAVAQGREGAWDGDDRRALGFALTDVKTSDVAGLLPPTWVTDFAEELVASRPTVSAFDTRPLPPNGMTINWPQKTITGPLTGVQATEKTQVVSGKVAIGTQSSNIVTYAGGNDVSIQTILRSTPDYLTLLYQEYGYEMASLQDIDTITAIVAEAAPMALPNTPADINEGLAAAAAVIWGAMRGATPNRFVLGLGVWEYLAGAADADGRPLFPAMSGMNPVGQLTITTQNGEARGLAFSVDPYLDPNTALIGWNRAVTTWLGPVATMSADAPAVLGRDVALFQFMATAVRRPDAVVALTYTPPGP